MSTDVQSAILLMAVGMVTVFLILGFVVLTGKFVIKLSNSIPSATPMGIASGRTNVAAKTSSKDGLQSNSIAAISAAIAIATKGQGKIVSIQKLNK